MSGPDPIPVSEMLQYAQAFSIGDLEEFVELIQAADTTFLSVVRKQNGRETGSNNRRGQSRARR